MAELPVPAANKNAALPFEGVEAFLADVKKLRALLKSDSVEEVERGLQHASALARKVEAAKHPIETAELGRELAVIVAAFPNSRAADADFAAVLLAAVAVMRPSIGAVKLATRHLVFTAKFLPAVSEVREAIKEQAKRLSYIEWDAGRLPKHLAYLKEQQRRAEEEKRKEEERERQEAERLRQEVERNRAWCAEWDKQNAGREIGDDEILF